MAYTPKKLTYNREELVFIQAVLRTRGHQDLAQQFQPVMTRPEPCWLALDYLCQEHSPQVQAAKSLIRRPLYPSV
jgi:hypothetical protein